MRSLFIKIFLWFWFSMTLVGIASVLSAVTTESPPFFIIRLFRFLPRSDAEHPIKPEPGTLRARWLGAIGQIITLSGRTAAEIYERHGKASYLAYLDQLARASHIRLILLDEQNRSLSGSPVPRAAARLALRADQTGGVAFAIKKGSFLVARPFRSPARQYSVVARLPAARFMNEKQSMPVVHLVVIFLTAGGVCWWLARYITSPIRKLGSAARRLTKGDLSVRVGPAVGNRHDEISELARDFDRMAERIESLMTAQHRLMRDISHELRSPLARLGVALELVRRRSDPEAHPALDRIEREADLLNDLIGQLLVLTRLESGAKAAATESLDVAALVREIAADADFEARSREVVVRVVSDEPCRIEGVKPLLRSAVENIVRNAVRYSDEGNEVAILVRCAPDESPAHALIQVRDHGPGVPPSALGDLFRPFYRVGDVRDRKDGGAGLGLAIAQRAIAIHGGSVGAANAPDGGLIVTVTLPVDPDLADAPAV